MAAGSEGTMDSIPDSNDFFASNSYGSSAAAPARQPTLSVEEMRGVKDRAMQAVTVPQEVVDLLVDLRTHLQVCGESNRELNLCNHPKASGFAGTHAPTLCMRRASCRARRLNTSACVPGWCVWQRETALM